MTDNKNLGDRGEILTKKYLTDHGYEIITSNYRTHHLEIDLIAKHQKKNNFH